VSGHSYGKTQGCSMVFHALKVGFAVPRAHV